MREYRCQICGRSYLANDSHSKTAHPEFWQWRRGFFVRFVLLGSVGIPILIVVDYFAFQITNSDLLVALVNFAYIYLVVMNLVRYPQKKEEFKSQWNLEHRANV